MAVLGLGVCDIEIQNKLLKITENYIGMLYLNQSVILEYSIFYQSDNYMYALNNILIIKLNWKKMESIKFFILSQIL